LPREDFSPPLNSIAYRVNFYYATAFTGPEYWKEEGKYWSKDVDRFSNPSDRIRQAVAQIVAPGDTDQQKLQKIYAAVMQLENTRFTREHSAAENKSEGLRVKTAADIWDQKRGSDDEITRLFISMARAAGFKAYAMIVTERDRNILNTGILDWVSSKMKSPSWTSAAKMCTSIPASATASSASSTGCTRWWPVFARPTTARSCS